MAYNRLLELSDGDIDDFLEDFIEKDRRFFILFRYALSLNVRNEGLEQRIQEIQVGSWLSVSPLSRSDFGSGWLCPLPSFRHHCLHQSPAPATQVGLEGCEGVAKIRIPLRSQS